MNTLTFDMLEYVLKDILRNRLHSIFIHFLKELDFYTLPTLMIH